MSKHTPGPWIAICPSSRNFHEGNDITHYDVMTEKTRKKLREDGFNHYRDDPCNVDNVSIVSMNFWRDMTSEEANANASLIAAAPDLLASLEEVLAYCVEHGHDWMCMAQARAAIIKATGDAQ